MAQSFLLIAKVCPTMARSALIFMAALLFAVSTTALAQAPAGGAELCDRLVASPYDPTVLAGEGVAFEMIDAEAAIDACSIAVEAAPDNAKLRFQLGRAFDAAERFDEAIASYEAAAAQGSMLAVSALGALYDGGYGVADDPAKAAELYGQAAEGGLTVAMTNLGRLYEDGRGVPQDYGRAAELYAQAAAAGSAYGAGALGYLTEIGLGVPADEAEAVRLYRIAAEGGEAFAQRNMGVMYAAGRGGLQQNDEEAVKYFSMAADQHYAPAYLDLALIYKNGTGVDKDTAEAERYLRMAIVEGDPQVQGDARNDLAWLFATENVNLQEAEALARAAVAADPEKAHKIDTLAWVLHLTGKDQEALPLAEKAVGLDGANAEIVEHLSAIKAAKP